MKLFAKKLRKDVRGFSIVEMLIAVGILAAVSTVIGSAMVFSAQSYQGGTTEATLQQDSHFSAKMIESLIVDATDSVTFDDATSTLVIQNVDASHAIALDSSAKELVYTCTELTSGSVSSSVLAKHVTEFKVDASKFAANRNAQVTIGMEMQGRTISTVYNVTSRNDPNSTTAITVTRNVTINCISEVTLEPNQEYSFIVGVTAIGGASSDYDLELSAADDFNTKAEKVADGVHLVIGNNEEGGASGKLVLMIKSKEKDVTGNPVALKMVDINIRRVQEVVPGPGNCISGTKLKAGAVYEVPAVVNGTNMTKVLAADYDTDYMDTSGVTWSFEMADGSDANDYVELVSSTEDVSPSVQFKLKQDLIPEKTIYVVASSKHSRGTVDDTKTNKTEIQYEEIKAKWALQAKNFSLISDFLRGDDNDYIQEYIEWNKIKEDYGGDKVRRSIRYIPAKLDAAGNVLAYTGTWSEWSTLVDSGTPGRTYIRPRDLDLNPCQAYAVEVMYEYVDGSGTVHWPTSSTEREEYVFEFTIPAVMIQLNDYTNYSGNVVVFPVGTYGVAQSEALEFRRDNLHTINFSVAAGHVDKLLVAGNHMKYKLEYYDTSTGKWVEKNLQEWGIGFSAPTEGWMKIKPPATIGMYRFTLKWDETWLLNNYGDASVNLADETTGVGIIYFKVLD